MRKKADLRSPWLRVLKGHKKLRTDGIRCLVTLPDGRLASGSYDGTVRVWRLDGEESEAVVLKGHTKAVRCLAVLSDGWLASGSDDGTVRVWRVDGEKGESIVLRGHEEAVTCLAVLSDGRLASGSSDNGEVRVWRIDGQEGEAVVLRCWDPDASLPRGPVTCLAALFSDGQPASESDDGKMHGQLASGYDDGTVLVWCVECDQNDLVVMLQGDESAVACLVVSDGQLVSGSDDGTVRVWSVRAIDQYIGGVMDWSVVLKGHTKAITCLTVLSDGQLASGSKDGTVRVWRVDGEEGEAVVLKGHTDRILCLAVLSDGQLASGSLDTTVRVWHVDGEEGESIVLTGNMLSVQCLTVLSDGQLASLGGDGAVRIVWQTNIDLLCILECGSPFEFEMAISAFNEQHGAEALGTLIEMVVDQCAAAPDPSAGARVQANVFEAVAFVISQADATRAPQMIDALAPCVIDLVHNDALLPDMMRRGLSSKALETLTPTAIFRCVLDAKFAAGPRLILWFDLFLFLVLGACFTRVTYLDRHSAATTAFSGEKPVELAFAFVILAYFTLREALQMFQTRRRELSSGADSGDIPPAALKGGPKGCLVLLIFAAPRLTLLLVLAAPLLLAFLAAMAYAKVTGGSSDWFDDWFDKYVFHFVFYDPLTFLGLPRAWRRDVWNWFDAAALACTWAVLARSAATGATDLNSAVTAALLLWIKLLGFLKSFEQFAKFVIMLQAIVYDIRHFIVVVAVIGLMFGHVFYLRLGELDADSFGFHDDGTPNPFATLDRVFMSLYLLGFVGDFDADTFQAPVDKFLLAMFILMFVVVMLNVLIAIVSDSYDAAMAESNALFCRSRFELITETASFHPTWLGVSDDEIKRMLKERLGHGDDDSAAGADTGRIQDIVRRVQSGVKNEVRRVQRDTATELEAMRGELAETSKKMDLVLAALEKRSAAPLPLGDDDDATTKPPPTAMAPIDVDKNRRASFLGF